MVATPQVAVDAKGLVARLEGCTEGLAMPSVIALIEKAGVKVNAGVQATLAALADAQGIVRCEDGTVIAEAVLPEHDQPTRLEPVELHKPDPDAQRIDYRAAAKLPLFSRGQEVARIIPHTPGRDGLSVRGDPIAHRTCKPEQVKLKKNVALAADSRAVVATVDGLLRIDALSVWVDPFLEIRRDVDFTTGHIEFNGDINIGGSVLDLFHVRAVGNVNIGQTVNAAVVQAGQNLHVQGGIIGREKGKCSAGGDVLARFIHGATVSAGAQVVAQTEITQCQIVADKVVVENGVIHSGTVLAREIRCKDLGSPGGVTTIVEAGHDDGLERFSQDTMPALREEFARLQTLHDQVSGLLRNQRAISAAQKERATEMLFEISEKQASTRQQVREWRERLTRSCACDNASIHVQRRIHPGVRLRLGDVEAEIDREIAGPVVIRLKPVRGTLQIIAIGPGSTLKLIPSHPRSTPARDAARKFLDEHAA
jgi:uncharacterized protein (DUF342 family)